MSNCETTGFIQPIDEPRPPRSMGDWTEVWARAAAAAPRLSRGQVWCRTCGATQKVDSAKPLQIGWPRCCGLTMTVDAPEER